MKKLLLSLVSILIFSYIVGCANAPIETPLVDLTIIEDAKDVFPALDSHKFGDPIKVENEDDILDLSDEQKHHFLSYFNSFANKNKPEHQRLYEYLQNLGETFQYVNSTNNARIALETENGNCMSLAVLTTALARIVDIEIKYQLVNRIPVFQEYGSVIFNAQHIRSVIYEPLPVWNDGINFKRKLAIIDYFPSNSNFVDRSVSYEAFIAMYYRNLSAEALGRDENNLAYWLLKESLKIEPENSKTINSLAVLHRRIGDHAKAEELYKYGIKNASNKISLLKNYKVLLVTQKRFDDAEKISKELENLEDLNPFNWLLAAGEAFEEKDFNLAFKLYNKSIELAPYLHQGYFGLAKTQLQRGNIRAAENALKTAKKEAFDLKSKSLYEAKLIALSEKRFN